MEEHDLIIGIHSIIAALQNPERIHVKLVGTEEGIEEIKKKIEIKNLSIDLCSSHKLQEDAKGYFRELDLDYQRVPSGVFLITSRLEIHEVDFLYEMIAKKENLKILCLDQISDVHNAAAILRTASFYGVDCVVVPDKRSFGLTPSFFRIASGAAEYIPLVGVNKLTKTVTKLQNNNILCMALSEHAKGDLDLEKVQENETGVCLILGREDVGISHAVLRLVENHISLKSQGEIQSLNVASAAAITMEKCFSKS